MRFWLSFFLAILFKSDNIKFSKFCKSDIETCRLQGKVGVFSEMQQFIANIVYALMIVKMVNAVGEAGNYWIVNNFICGLLLIPINALSEIVKHDCKDGYAALKQSNYYLIALFVIVIWFSSIPLWTMFFKDIQHLENYRQIFRISLVLLPFYIPYAFSKIPDSIFIGCAKTRYNFINTCLINFVYYGLWFAAYKANLVTFDINMICYMFGFGLLASWVVSIVQEGCFLRAKLFVFKMIYDTFDQIKGHPFFKSYCDIINV